MRVKLLAEAQGSTDKVTEIQSSLADLELRVPRLTIEVPAALGALPGLAIMRNGTPMIAAKWGQAEPVDPGVYKIEATALGKEPWTTEVEVKEAGKNVAVKIAPPWVEKRASAPVKSTPPVTAKNDKKRIGLILAGAGLSAAGIGLGLGFMLASNGKSSDAQAVWKSLGPSDCRISGNAVRCEELKSAYDGKELFRGIAIGGYVAGGALAVGTLVYALLPTSKSPSALLQPDAPATKGVRASVSVLPGGGGAVLEGTF